MAGGKLEPANGDPNNVDQPLAKDGLVSFIKHRLDPSRPWRSFHGVTGLREWLVRGRAKKLSIGTPDSTLLPCVL